MTKPILVGEINSHSAPVLQGFTEPYRNGIAFGLEEVNGRGGVLGRPLQFIFRDDEVRADRAAALAEQLIDEDKVDLLAGAFNSDIGIAIAEVADKRKKIYFATEPRTDIIIWEAGSRYVFRLRTCIWSMLEMLVELAANRPEKRWAGVIPSYRGGQRIANLFKAKLAARRPDVEWVADYTFDLGQLDPADLTAWLGEKQPEAMLTIVYGTDLEKYVRHDASKAFFRDRLVVNPLAGEPEYLEPLGADTPEDWVVLGYPGSDDKRPELQAFQQAYAMRHGEEPQLGALLGYMTVQGIVAGIERAGSVETEAMADAFKGLRFASPIGEILFRAADHQATMGAWRGSLTQKNGKGVMKDWAFLDGNDYLPTEEEAAKLRPAGK